MSFFRRRNYMEWMLARFFESMLRFWPAGSFSLCEEVPSGPPVLGQKFDLIYSFSVLTHLSEDCHLAVLGSLRQAISNEGIFVTIRPETFWDAARDRSTATVFKRRYMESGFSFHCNSPH